MIPHARAGSWTAVFRSEFYFEWADKTDHQESGARCSGPVPEFSISKSISDTRSKPTIVALLFLT